MPREYVWGDTVTVRRGDLPILAARTRAAAAQVLDETGETGETSDFDDYVTSTAAEVELVRQLQATHAALRELEAGTSVLRRRHQLLSAFVDDLVNLDGTTTDYVEFTREFRRRAQSLRIALEALPPDDPDVATYGSSAGDVVTDAAELVVFRRFASDVGRTNAADGFPADARDVLTPLVTRLAEELLELRRASVAPTAETAETRPTRTDPATSGPNWRTPDPACPRRDYVHAGHRDPLPPDPATPNASGGVLDCPGLGPTPTPTDPAPVPDRRPFLPDAELDDAVGPDPDDTVTLQLALVLTWVRDGGRVTVGIVGHNHDTGADYDVGGYYLDLDWAAANKAVRKFRVARDQSHGSPE